jgi:GST-like protein
MIELYAFPTPNGHKICIALEALALDYRVIPINITRDDQFWPEFLAISPNNRIPAIVDLAPDDHDGPLPVFESGAILIYLAEKTGRLLPAVGRARKAVLEWLMWQMGGLGPMLGQAHHFRRFAPEPLDYPIRRYTDEARRLYGVLDTRLQHHDWVADDFSIADIAIYPWVMAPYDEWQGVAIGDFPNVAAWRERMAALPAVQRGLKAGEDHWSDPPLDAEARRQLFLRQ